MLLKLSIIQVQPHPIGMQASVSNLTRGITQKAFINLTEFK